MSAVQAQTQAKKKTPAAKLRDQALARERKNHEPDLRNELAGTVNDLALAAKELASAVQAYVVVEPVPELQTAAVALSNGVANLELARNLLRRKA